MIAEEQTLVWKKDLVLKNEVSCEVDEVVPITSCQTSNCSRFEVH